MNELMTKVETTTQRYPKIQTENRPASKLKLLCLTEPDDVVFEVKYNTVDAISDLRDKT